MDVKDLKRLLEAVKEAEVGELVLETGDYKLTVKRGGAVQVAQLTQSAPTQSREAQEQQPQPQTQSTPVQEEAQPAPSETASTEAAPNSNLAEITAPIVGTFYAGPSPDAPDYVKVGDKVEAGAVLCIIEAMKLMNEIEADTAGTVKEILIENEEPVEYGQVLFRIEPG